MLFTSELSFLLKGINSLLKETTRLNMNIYLVQSCCGLTHANFRAGFSFMSGSQERQFVSDFVLIATGSSLGSEF